MNINKPPDEIIRKRHEICVNCERATGPRHNETKKVKCLECGCLINHKIRLKNEKCPIGKWGKFVE
jgi:hypothetical protein